MSEHQQAQNTTQLNANLVAFIFIFTFTITGIFIVSNMKPHAPQSQEGASAEVALAESATSVVPSDTPVPPTNTAMPTSTSMPLSTNTSMPTSAAATPAANTTPQTVADAGQAVGGNTAVSYDPALVTKGEQLFLTCSACHGADALGVLNLGKNLVDSEFMHSLSDQDLLTFVKTGRPIWDTLNTTGIDMPPKGGNPAFTDEDILAIIAYLRSISAASGQAVPSSDRGAAATAVSVQPTPLPTSGAEATAAIGAPAVAYDPALVSRGEELFLTCSACHGADALGLPNLGKNLVDSEFMHSLSDQDLLTFVKTGRPIWDALNTTGIDMPPKGGNPAFTDEDILAIIAYLRSISTASGQAVPSSDRGAAATAVSVQPTPLPTSGAEATAAIGAPAVAYDPALVSRGEELFLTCSACHGADALGLPNLGKNLVDSEFMHSLSDQDLLTFVKTGRPSWDALNTSGIDMPPKGGNPAFTDEDILAIIAYIRTLSASQG